MESYIATCPEETKELLGEELATLGAQDVKLLYKAVQFEAPKRTAYAMHLRLRTGSRLLRVLKTFPAKTPDDILYHSKRVDWESLLPGRATFLVDGVAAERGEKALSSNEISKSVRLGLQSYFRDREMPIPQVDLKDPTVVLVAHMVGGRVTLSVDTSGKVLHKRGYRLEGHPAPLKETLASSLLMLAGYDGTMPFLDPMCGSGTLAIEAAYIALHKAPLIHRKKDEFGFELLKDFDRELWREVQEEIRGLRLEEPPCPIYANDISGEYIGMARNNALRARVEKHITFSQSSFFEMEKPAEHGLIVTNLPFGERIDSVGLSLEEFYGKVGTTLKHKFQGWTAALLVAEEAPIKAIGLKPRKKIPILNGSIACKFMIFDLFGGKRIDHITRGS